jgi:hypothetical protein
MGSSLAGRLFTDRGLGLEKSAMDAGHHRFISEYGSSKERSSMYYRTEAERARRLLADATTSRLKQYLAEIIARCERLAGEDEKRACDI